ncbi:hypothetical protein HN51_055084, partial [Arachis hypogaea]
FRLPCHHALTLTIAFLVIALLYPLIAPPPRIRLASATSLVRVGLAPALLLRPCFIKFVADIFPLLQIYAGSFFAIPLVRWFFIRKRNADIEKRNKIRKQCSKVLELPDLSLRQKAMLLDFVLCVQYRI